MNLVPMKNKQQAYKLCLKGEDVVCSINGGEVQPVPMDMSLELFFSDDIVFYWRA